MGGHPYLPKISIFAFYLPFLRMSDYVKILKVSTIKVYFQLEIFYSSIHICTSIFIQVDIKLFNSLMSLKLKSHKM